MVLPTADEIAALEIYLLLNLSKNTPHCCAGKSNGMVGVPGLEPGASSLSGMRSNQLSYTP